MKHETDFIIKHNKFLAEHTIKNEISQLLCKDKHGNDIYEHGKQMNHTNLFLTCHRLNPKTAGGGGAI